MQVPFEIRSENVWKDQEGQTLTVALMAGQGS